MPGFPNGEWLTVWALAEHIVECRRGTLEISGTPADYQSPPDMAAAILGAFPKIKEAARDGLITIWGRPQRGGTDDARHVRIPKAYWLTAGIDPIGHGQDARAEPTGKVRFAAKGVVAYVDLRIPREQALVLWPDPSEPSAMPWIPAGYVAFASVVARLSEGEDQAHSSEHLDRLRNALFSGDVPSWQLMPDGRLLVVASHTWAGFTGDHMLRNGIPTLNLRQTLALRRRYGVHWRPTLVMKQADADRLLTSNAAPEPAPEPLQPEAAAMVTKAKLEGWYIDRVKSWPADRPPPSREQDCADARARFPKVARKRLRELRRDHAPESWHQGGPRRRSKV
jgi:hypothetical protein